MNMKKILIPGAIGLATVGGIAGGSLVGANGVSAATPTSSSTVNAVTAADTTSTSQQSDPTGGDSSQRDQSQGGHVGSNGTKETLLTGDTATKVTAAAKAALPGATVLRVENDAEGATYEAHMRKADGTQVTVKLDAGFKVTGTEDGPGMPPGGSSSATN